MEKLKQEIKIKIMTCPEIYPNLMPNPKHRPLDVNPLCKIDTFFNSSGEFRGILIILKNNWDLFKLFNTPMCHNFIKLIQKIFQGSVQRLLRNVCI